MCGVAGILSLDGSPVQHTSLKAMTEALRHRGPDEGAVILLGDEDGVPRDAIGRDTRRGTTRPATRIGLGHRRLKVIDLSGAAAQPMRHAGGAWLVYNGEIYNAPDLRADLQARGARFRSRSDTEVVLEALCAWGSAALPRLNGMFVLAFWDPRGRRLLLARDRFGEKPLYYARTGGLLLFASELGALLRHGEVSLEIDLQALELYLTFGFIPAPWTIYRGVRKLSHASCLEAGPGREPMVSRYYRLEERRGGEVDDQPEEGVRRVLEESVRRRLEADVPLGAFLSGGLDSTAVVAFMRRARAAPPRTYSMGIPDLPYFDESHPARRTAERLGTLHHEVPVTASRLQAEIPFVLGRLDEPFADSSALASSVIASRLARDDRGGEGRGIGERLVGHRARGATRPDGGPLGRRWRRGVRGIPSVPRACVARAVATAPRALRRLPCGPPVAVPGASRRRGTRGGAAGAPPSRRGDDGAGRRSCRLDVGLRPRGASRPPAGRCGRGSGTTSRGGALPALRGRPGCHPGGRGGSSSPRRHAGQSRSHQHEPLSGSARAVSRSRAGRAGAVVSCGPPLRPVRRQAPLAPGPQRDRAAPCPAGPQARLRGAGRPLADGTSRRPLQGHRFPPGARRDPRNRSPRARCLAG